MTPQHRAVTCSRRLGRLLCDRRDPHDPAAVGGHTYTSRAGSHVGDKHTEPEQR